jgi:hypothetical protein
MKKRIPLPFRKRVFVLYIDPDRQHHCQNGFLWRISAIHPVLSKPNRREGGFPRSFLRETRLPRGKRLRKGRKGADGAEESSSLTFFSRDIFSSLIALKTGRFVSNQPSTLPCAPDWFSC